MKLLGREGLEVREVKAQAAVVDERAGLVDVLAQDRLEGGVEQVRGGVVAADELAAVRVDRGAHGVAHVERALGDLGDVRVQAAVALGVADLELGGVAREGAGVAHLAAHLGVERGAVEHDLDLGAGLGRLDGGATRDDGDDLGALELVAVVALELRGGQLVGQRGPDVVEVAPGVAVGGGAGAALLLGHGGVEAIHVDVVAGAGGDLDGQVDGEAVGVVQLEGDLARQRGAGLETLEGLIEVGAARVERVGEALLLGADDALDQRDVLEQVGVGLAHQAVNLVDERGEESALDAQQAAVEDGTAQQAAQDVLAALVARQDAVGDHEVDRAGVVGDDAQRAGGAGVLVSDVGLARDLLAQGDEALHEVTVIVGALVLHDAGHALEAHARVEVAVGQLGHRTVLLAVELGEDEVPELEEAVAVAAGLAVGLAAADLLALVVVDLGAGSAGAGGAGGPEVVVLAQAGDVVLGDAQRAPDVVGLVVVGEDGEVEAVERQLELLSDQFEGPGAGLLLGDAAKGEVAKHLEERQVTAVLADAVDVIGAHALLAGAGANLLHRLLALVVLLELVHASVGEKQRRVLGNERGAGVQLEASVLEELEERRANLGGSHGRKVSGAHMSPLRSGFVDGHTTLEVYSVTAAGSREAAPPHECSSAWDKRLLPLVKARAEVIE